MAAALNEKGTAEWIVLNSNDMKTETTDGGEGINDDYAIEDVRVSGDDVRVFISNGSTENGDIADADTITLQPGPPARATRTLAPTTTWPAPLMLQLVAVTGSI